MKISIIQIQLIWENKKLNLENLNKFLEGIEDDTELVILPEMFTSGFSMTPNNFVQENDENEVIEWMKLWCKNKNIAICGSIAIKENQNFYNRLLFVYPNGIIKKYDKRHLFTLAGEDKIYTKGKERIIIEYNGWNILPLICYDLRFPVYSRNSIIEDGIENNTISYDLIIYVANWPDTRINAWDSLLKARAIENMSYVIGVNRIGTDNNHSYVGHSQIIDCMGNYVIQPQHNNENVFYATIDKSCLDSSRNKLQFLNDSDKFILK